MTTNKTTRTGSSLIHTPQNCPRELMLKLQFSEEATDRMMRVRRALPYLEEQEARLPALDARKLWERIGKPHKQFRFWADQCIKPQLPNEEITSLEIPGPKGGKPAKEYTLSRSLAAQLAMQARTPEGAEVRLYFLDMERLAVRLAEHSHARAGLLIRTDNAATHHFRMLAGDAAKTGLINKGAVSAAATELERGLKRRVCEILTGRSTATWRETFGKGVRDVINGADLDTYARAYDMALSLHKAGIRESAELERCLKAFSGAVPFEGYALAAPVAKPAAVSLSTSALLDSLSTEF